MNVIGPTYDAVLDLLPFTSPLFMTVHDSSSTEWLILLTSSLISIETNPGLE